MSAAGAGVGVFALIADALDCVRTSGNEGNRREVSNEKAGRNLLQIRALVAALVAEREWRTIESAPKDDWVLVKTKIGDVITAHQQFGYWYAWIDYVGPEFVIEDVVGWMPTPPTTGDDHG